MGRAISNSKLKRFIEDSRSMRDDPDFPLFQAGIDEGKLQMKRLALSFLEDKYLGPDAPARGTPEATAILTLANELSKYLHAQG